jgi:hypothetical protein
MFAIYIWVQSYELSQKFPNVLEKKYNKSGNCDHGQSWGQDFYG